MTPIDKIENAGLFLIGEDSDYLGVKYAFLVSTKNRIDIYDGCEFAAFNKEEECIAVGNETGGSGMGQMGGWTWIRGVMDNRYEPSDKPPKNTVTVKLGYVDSNLIGGKWMEYSHQKSIDENAKIGCRPAY